MYICIYIYIYIYYICILYTYICIHTYIYIYIYIYIYMNVFWTSWVRSIYLLCQGVVYSCIQFICSYVKIYWPDSKSYCWLFYTFSYTDISAPFLNQKSLDSLDQIMKVHRNEASWHMFTISVFTSKPY